MKALLRPSAILLYLLTIVFFFLLGSFLAAQSGVADEQGLAASAIVMSYGLMAAIFALILSIILAFGQATQLLIRLNVVYGILLLAFIGYLFWMAKA